MKIMNYVKTTFSLLFFSFSVKAFLYNVFAATSPSCLSPSTLPYLDIITSIYQAAIVHSFTASWLVNSQIHGLRCLKGQSKLENDPYRKHPLRRLKKETNLYVNILSHWIHLLCREKGKEIESDNVKFDIVENRRSVLSSLWYTRTMNFWALYAKWNLF